MHAMKVLIFGSRGYLGGHFMGLYPEASTPSVDIADAQAVAEALDAAKPDVVINAAGKTGKPNVDWCESHRGETLRSNVLGPLVLLEECTKRKALFVHLGSGCIYEGDNGGRGFAESDRPNFTGSFYSRTKLWSDQILREFPVLNLRLRMPFDGSLSPRNLLMKLRGYTRVLDVENSLTYIPDLLRAAAMLIEKRRTGTFNVVNPGAISPFDIMTLYREQVDPSHTFERLTLKELPSVAKTGRSNCVLSGESLANEGLQLLPVREALADAFASMREAHKS